MTPASAGAVVVPVDDNADLERRFGGLRRLYGDAGYARIRAAHVAVIGVGGVGSWAAEALLAIANCQAELKDSKAARRTIEDLLKTYPKSEAAQAGRERLASLK